MHGADVKLTATVKNLATGDEVMTIVVAAGAEEGTYITTER